MSIQEGSSPDTPLRTACDKSVWQRQYMRQRLQDPEYREKYNKYQREYQKNKRATDPEYCERRKAIKQKYRSKLLAKLRPSGALDAPHPN